MSQQPLTIEDQVERFRGYLAGLSAGAAWGTAGIYAGHFWLQEALCK